MADQSFLSGVVWGMVALSATLLLYYFVLAPRISFSPNVRAIPSICEARYFIRVQSPRWIRLIDVTVRCRISIYDILENDRKFWNTFEIKTSFPYMEYLIPGVFTIRLFLNESESFKNSTILDCKLVQKATSGTLRLEDVYLKYMHKTKLTLSIIGHDKFTGVKKLYISKDYTLHNFINGEWSAPDGISLRPNAATLKDRAVLSVHPHAGL